MTNSIVHIYSYYIKQSIPSTVRSVFFIVTRTDAKKIVQDIAPLCNMSVNEYNLRKHMNELGIETKRTKRGLVYNLQLVKHTPEA